MICQQEAVNKARAWVNETGKPCLVYQDDHYFLATSLERYEPDPQGYRRCHVVEVIQPLVNRR